MNVTVDQARSDATKTTQDDGLKPYKIIIPAGRDWGDETIYSFMCADIAQRNTLPLSSDRFDGLVGAMISTMDDQKKPIIIPAIPSGQLRERGEFVVDGKKVFGYEMEVTVEMQRDFLSRSKEELKNPPPPAKLSEEYKNNLAGLDKEAAALQEKFAAINDWYQSKNTRHGLGAYTGYYLDRADGDALALQNARNDAKNPNLLNSQTRLETALSLGNRRMDELFPDHRNLTPEQMVKRLNDSYEAGFEQAKQVSSIIGKIPGPVGAIGEFSINQLCNGLRYSSGDITADQALAEVAKDGTKMVVSLAVKSEKAEKAIDKVGEFINDTAVNVTKRIAEAEKSLKDDPNLDRQEVMRNAILHGVGDATLNAVGKNLKLDKYGFSAGADGIKEFGVNLSKNLIEEYQNTTRKLAKDDQLDKTQLYKEAAARALINATTETFGKSVKGLGDGKGEREFLIDVATKLGIQDPVKQYLDSQKSLAEPKKIDSTAPTPEPKQRSDLVVPASNNDPVGNPASQDSRSHTSFEDARYVVCGEPIHPMAKLVRDLFEKDPIRHEGPPEEWNNNVASALLLAAVRQDIINANRVMLNKDGTRLIAVQGDERSEFCRTVSVVIQDAARQPAQESLAQVALVQAANGAASAKQQDDTTMIAAKSPQNESSGPRFS